MGKIKKIREIGEHLLLVKDENALRCKFRDNREEKKRRGVNALQSRLLGIIGKKTEMSAFASG